MVSRYRVELEELVPIALSRKRTAFSLTMFNALNGPKVVGDQRTANYDEWLRATDE
jgi:hypothetical protein